MSDSFTPLLNIYYPSCLTPILSSSRCAGQLGWYSDHHLEYTPTSGNCLTIVELVGLSEYGVVGNNQAVIVKVVEPSTNKGYYVMFNRATGMNQGTGEPFDHVMITEQEDLSINNFAYSYLLEELDQGEVFTLSNFNGSGEDL